MSLLGLLDNADARFSIGLLAAAAPRFERAGFGDRLNDAISGADEYKRQKEQENLRNMQIDAYKRKMEQEKNAIELAKKQREAASKNIIPAVAATPDKPLNLATDTGPNVFSTSPSNMVGGGTPAKPSSFNHEGYIQSLYEMSMPEQALEWQAKVQKDDTPVKLAPGESLYSGKASGYKPLLSVPKPEEKSAEQKGYDTYISQGGQLGWLDYLQALRRAGASNQTVINAGPKAFDTELGKIDAEQLRDWRKAAESGSSSIDVVNRLRGAEKMGAYSGPTANARLSAGRIIGDITGTIPKGVVGSELYNAEASKLVLEHVKTLGANPSNADREFIEKTVPQLATSAEARQKLADFIERKAQKSVSLYKSADAYARKNKGLGGFNQFDDGATNIDALVDKYNK